MDWDEIFAMAEAGLNVRVTANTVEILSNKEVAAIIAQGDK